MEKVRLEGLSKKKNQKWRANENDLALLFLSFYSNMPGTLTQLFIWQLSKSDCIKGITKSGLCNKKRTYKRKIKNYMYSLS